MGIKNASLTILFWGPDGTIGIFMLRETWHGGCVPLTHAPSSLSFLTVVYPKHNIVSAYRESVQWKLLDKGTKEGLF